MDATVESLPILDSSDTIAAEGTMTSWGEVSQQQRERGSLTTASAFSRQEQQQEPAGARSLREPMCSPRERASEEVARDRDSKSS